jgi:transcriptional regulator with XRE-family HTH domain
MIWTFGELVIRFRKKKDLSQNEVAEASGLSLAQIVKIERDDRNKKAPIAFRESTLKRLAHGLRLSKTDRALLFEAAWEREKQLRARKSDIARLVAGILKTSSPNEESKEGDTPDSAGDRQKYSQPRALVGMREVADCAIWMLKNAPPLQQVGAEEILVTTQGDSSIFKSLGELDLWGRELRSVMRRNWNVVSLYRMTGEIDRAFEVIRDIRDVSIRPKQYMPRYFKLIGALRPTYNLLIVPRIGGLFALSTHNPTVIDAAFFYPATHPSSGPYIDSLMDHFTLLYAETDQLARPYEARSVEWEDTLTRVCQLEADEFLATNYIDTLTMPPALQDESLKELLTFEGTYSSMAFRRIKTHLIQRREAFERYVKSYKYLTIMPERSFTEVLQSEDAGFYRYPIPNYPQQSITVEKRQVIEHIEYLIRDLRHYDNYEIALIADNYPNEKDLLRTPWLVKGEEVALIEPYTESADGVDFQVTSDLEITEPSVVRAFRQQFLDIWNAITDPDKAQQKENVIRWLTKLLEEVRGNPEGSHD